MIQFDLLAYLNQMGWLKPNQPPPISSFIGGEDFCRLPFSISGIFGSPDETQKGFQHFFPWPETNSEIAHGKSPIEILVNIIKMGGFSNQLC